MIGHLEDGTSCGGLRLLPFLVGSCKEFLEGGTGLFVVLLALPEFAAVVEDYGMEQDLERNGDKLVRGVGRVSGGGAVHRIFDLNDGGFERLIARVGSPESRVVFLQGGGGNVCVGGINMVK